MATNEALENQTHEAGDETYSNKFNDRNNQTIDHLGEQHRDQDEHQLQQQNNCNEKGIESVIATSNGQSSTMNTIDQSTDTTNTTTTSSSRANSPLQTMHAQEKQDAINKNDVAKLCEDFEGDSGTNLDDSKARISRHVGHTDGQDGDDEDEGDEDLEEGELKDDDDDDDDDDEDDNNNTSSNRFSNSNDNNIPKDASVNSDSRLQNDPNSQNNLPHYGGAHRSYNQHHNNRRHFSPNQQHHPGMHHPQYPPYQQPFPGNNNYRFPPGPDGGMPPVMIPHMNQPPAGPGDMYGPRGAPVNAGPVQKVNIKCRYYSKTINKCTWGEQCRFRHREDSPSMMNDGFEDRPPGPSDMGPIPSRGPLQPPMGAAERFYPTPSMPPQPYGYGPPYEHHPPYGPHQSASPPLPSYPVPPHHWRQQQHGGYPPPSSSAHHPESISPALVPNPGGGQPLAPNSSGRVPPSQASVSGSSTGPPAALSPGGASSPGFSSSPSSSAIYERKSRLAYEAAPWNDRGYSQASRYDRNDPAGGYPPPNRGGYYRNHYGRDPYAREPIPHPHHHMGGPPYNYPSGYPPNYPSAYRGGPQPGPPYSSHHRYSSSSQRTAPSDVRLSKSNKRARDGESSWSDSGSEDSLLNQAGAISKSHSSKISKKHHRTSAQASEDPDIDTPAAAKDDLDQGGSGTPPGEPLPEDKERQELLLEKLREIEDLMAKKKEEDSL